MKKPISIAPNQIVRPALSVPVHSFLIHNCDVNIRAGQIQIAKAKQHPWANPEDEANAIQQLEDMISNFERAKKELGRGKR